MEAVYLSKVAAFHNLIAISHLHGDGRKGFEDIFPSATAKPLKKKVTTAELKAAFEKHKIHME